MKKYKVVLFACVLMLLLSFGVAVNAAKIGDVTGKVVYSDISAYINHAPIPSYVIDGVGTVIVAEDLKDYGCDVVWNGSERALYVTRNADKNFVKRNVFKSNQPTGTKFADLLYTDIKVYVNGILVPSYAINGYTMITMEDFGRCMDGFTWAQDIRAAKAWMDSHPIQTFKPVRERIYHLFRDELYNDPFLAQGYFDFNSDGVDEYYKVQTSFGKYGADVSITVGDTKIQPPSECSMLSVESIYALNLDGGDNYTLAVFFGTYSGIGSVLSMWTYENGRLKSFEFDNGSGYTYTEQPAHPEYIDVGDDSSLTLSYISGNIGNWNIYRKYALKNRVYTEVVPEAYSIPIEYAQAAYYVAYYSGENLSQTDMAMIEKGFIKAAASCQYGSFNIKKGEYIRLAYEKEGAIFVQKADGTGAWIYAIFDRFHTPLNLEFIPDVFFIFP